MSEELRLDGPCRECGGPGPVVIVQCDTDPGDIGEPRIVHADDETIVFVPSFDLWSKTQAVMERERIIAAVKAHRCEGNHQTGYCTGKLHSTTAVLSIITAGVA